jgi:hypothetical protein
MPSDLANRHAARIHRDDLLVEIGKAALIFGQKLRIKRARTITRNIQRDLGRAGQNRLLRCSIAAVGWSAAFEFVIQMLVQLGAQDALRKRLLQIVEQTVLGKKFRRIAAVEKLVQ